MNTLQGTTATGLFRPAGDDDFTDGDVRRCLEDAPAWARADASVVSEAPTENSGFVVEWYGPPVDFGIAHAKLYQFDRYSPGTGIVHGSPVATFSLDRGNDYMEIHTPKEARDAAVALLQIADALEAASTPS